MELREHEKAAVFSILVRQVEAQEAKAAAEKQIAECTERAAEAQAIIANVRPALSVFGFDTSAPKLWDLVKAAIGNEAYLRAFRVARGEEERTQTVAAGKSGDEHEYEETGDEGETDENEAEMENETDNIEESEAPKIKDVVIERLRQSGEQGARLSEIKEFVTAQGIPMHEKTVGMTLYRLSKDGLTRRAGRTWYYIPPAETEGKIVAEGRVEPSSSATSVFE
ncbi:hypothetical protein [Mesorhizobium sp. B2-7-2]|uniref:hypothetical protein n=1 Tax=Mesorhizobium sp. B2-7-2 TaxID=2589908 RepID=UPI001127D400|nr:hypothetical protein [Mesorhizobium sp. B2-7-2]TPJ30937.1 hypothetical protein FJ425_04220 [Mesorhizobium sp. B2-7-2]